MNLTRWVLFCSLNSCIFASLATVDMAEYIVEIVDHLAKTESGIPNCVFYGGNQVEETLQKVVIAPQLDFFFQAKHVWRTNT